MAALPALAILPSFRPLVSVSATGLHRRGLGRPSRWEGVGSRVLGNVRGTRRGQRPEASSQPIQGLPPLHPLHTAGAERTPSTTPGSLNMKLALLLLALVAGAALSGAARPGERGWAPCRATPLCGCQRRRRGLACQTCHSTSTHLPSLPLLDPPPTDCAAWALLLAHSYPSSARSSACHAH